MANPTSNFGWQMPTSTDLVTDLPADFETFGQAVDTSLADLKGGTTGQVLSKASGTDMDFTWVAQDDSNAIQNAIVDAKGDLIAASAADTPARLAVGNNGETLVADSSTSTGLRWQGSMAGGKNAIINGGMDIWQRFTTKLNGQNSYIADRWLCSQAVAVTFSRQNAQDTTLPNIQYCMRLQRTSGSTDTTAMNLSQSLESSQSIPLSGKTITLSYYARAGANYSAASTAIRTLLYSGTGIDQNVYTAGFSGSVGIVDSSPTLTTTWQRFSFVATVPTNSTQLGLTIIGSPTGTAGANDYYEITGIQIELGSVATAFTRAGGTIQGELAACQRYYYRFASEGKTYASFNIGGYFESSTKYIGRHQHPVAMRTNPTTLDFANLSVIDTSGTFYAVSTAAIDTNTNTTLGTMINFTVSGATATRFGSVLINNNTGAFLGIGAEL